MTKCDFTFQRFVNQGPGKHILKLVSELNHDMVESGNNNSIRLTENMFYSLSHTIMLNVCSNIICDALQLIRSILHCYR